MKALGVFADFLLQEDEAPELVDEEVRYVFEGPRVALRELHPLERIEPEIGEDRPVELDRSADPAVGLVDQPELPVVDTNRAERAFGEVEDLVAVGWPLAGQQVRLVVAVEMNLVGRVAELLALSATPP